MQDTGRLDLVKVWKTLYVLCNPVVYGRPSSSGQPTSPAFFRDAWASLPISRNLVTNLFTHYEKAGDVQTLAMMSCILLQSKLNLRMTRKRHISVDEENELSLIDPKREHIANAYRYAYGEILSKWGLLVKRAELLKHMFGGMQYSARSHAYAGQGTNYIPPPHRAFDRGWICSTCGTKLKDGFFCGSCKTFGFKCVICNIAVRGLSNFCLRCGHGGHSYHMAQWFENQTYCPAGCGCRCIFDGFGPDSPSEDHSHHNYHYHSESDLTRSKSYPEHMYQDMAENYHQYNLETAMQSPNSTNLLNNSALQTSPIEPTHDTKAANTSTSDPLNQSLTGEEFFDFF